MKCRNCGAEINDGIKFCTECGQKMERERTFLDPFPELDEYRRVRNKIYTFDEHSKPLNIYCYVMIGIFAIVFIAGLILKMEFLSIFSGIFIGILLLMLWANNRQAKRVRIAIGRPIVIILPFLMLLIIIAAGLMHASGDPFDDPFFNGDSFDEESDVVIDSDAADVTVDDVDYDSQREYAVAPGTYIHEYKEEIGGEMVDIKDTIILNEDHSCEISFQDTIVGEWTDSKLILNNGDEMEFTVKGDELYLNQPMGWVTFTRN